MFTIRINGDAPIKIKVDMGRNGFTAQIGNEPAEGHILRINHHQYHLLYKGRSMNVDVLKMNPDEKSFLLRVNGTRMLVQVADKYDELLHSLGMDKTVGKKVGDIKAPMPGMVLKVLVEEGNEVKKGDALIVLEAMKMENILKAPADGVVKKISAVKGSAVEKNQVLIQF
jgi:biotin carboxyl carrier protein